MLSLLDPCPTLNRVDIGIIVFVAICEDFPILEEEGPLIEGVFVRQVSCLNDLLLRCVEQIRRT